MILKVKEIVNLDDYSPSFLESFNILKGSTIFGILLILTGTTLNTKAAKYE